MEQTTKQTQSLIANERRRLILEHLEEHASCKVSEIARQLGVSEMTIHRDLSHLAKLNLLKKVHGGAVRQDIIEMSFQDRAIQNQVVKEDIARAASRLVRPRQNIYLSPGTTVRELALLLDAAGLQIHTNSLPTATALARKGNPTFSVNLLGGRLVGFVEAVVGSTTEEDLQKLNLNYAFIGASALDLTTGITLYTHEEASVLRAAMRASRKTVLLVDDSKFDTRAGPVACQLADVHAIVTNHIPQHYLKYCQHHDVEVILTQQATVASHA